jgi:peroxiredoxin
MTKLLNIILCLFLIGHINTYSQSIKFKIEAHLKGYADNTGFKLQYGNPDEENKILLAKIKNEKLVFEGVSKNKVAQYIIQTEIMDEQFEYKYFWADDTITFIEGKKGELDKAKIVGSRTNQIAEEIPENNDQFDAAYQNKIKEFILKYPDNVLSAYIIAVYKRTWKKSFVVELFNLLDNSIRATIYGKQIQAYIDRNIEIEIGSDFADINLPDTSGVYKKLSDYKGNYILLDFWGSWCGPCIRDNVQLVELYKTYYAKGFRVYAVGAENSMKQWKNGIKKGNLPWTNVSDISGGNGEVFDVYGIFQYPSNFLINPEGKIIAKNVRGEALKETLSKIYDHD